MPKPMVSPAAAAWQKATHNNTPIYILKPYLPNMKFTTAAVIGLTAFSATVLPATNAQLTSILHNNYKKSNGEVDDVDVVGVGCLGSCLILMVPCRLQ